MAAGGLPAPSILRKARCWRCAEEYAWTTPKKDRQKVVSKALCRHCGGPLKMARKVAHGVGPPAWTQEEVEPVTVRDNGIEVPSKIVGGTVRVQPTGPSPEIDRRTYIGASESAALIGMDPYKDEAAVWASKRTTWKQESSVRPCPSTTERPGTS